MMLKGKWMFHVITLLLFLGTIGLAGQKGIMQTSISLPSLNRNIFDFTYVEFPFYLKLPFTTRQRDFSPRLFFGFYLVVNSPGNMVPVSSTLRNLILDTGWVWGMGFDIYLSPLKSEQVPKKRVYTRSF